jgi:glucosamine-6-phosphate deaminase
MHQAFRFVPTPVEKIALASSKFEAIYPPEERLPAIVIDNFPALGRLIAMRFLEWAQANPGGVISLPTGKTPEYFIKWVTHLLRTWETPKSKKILEEAGIDPGRKPDMRSLHFVQIDEFYPIYPTQHNSFFHYVNNFYIEGFGLDREKALLIDCSRIALEEGQTLSSVWPSLTVDLSLRVRRSVSALQEMQQKALTGIDEWCRIFEEKVRSLGGIGFFLGGIGPDGHIGFNVRGSDHHSTTRLMQTNYETQAAAATDLGGIEISRNRLVITIGLGTITYNRNCTAIIIAAGAAKAGVVSDAIQSEKTIRAPATVLHDLPNARFYLTTGAAAGLKQRRIQVLADPASPLSDEEVEKIVIDCAVRYGKRIDDLTDADAAADPFGAVVLKRRTEDWRSLCRMVRGKLIARIEVGAQTRLNTRFLHTEPHHDDIMLGYLPAVVRHVRSATNVHFFATLTSGFTAVTNQYIARLLASLREFLSTAEFDRLHNEGYFSGADPALRNADIWRYLDGVAAKDPVICCSGASRRLLRCLTEVFDETDFTQLSARIDELLHYFESEYPGKKDLPHIQRLKGMCREWEAECLWGYFGWNCESVLHLRLGFYSGDIFTEEPTVNRDVNPILELLTKTTPDVVSVALDPESSGPDTHYKALQALTEALRLYGKGRDLARLRIWGYRNVWFRFHPSEATVYVPVSLNMFSVMESAFTNTFASQRDASFPSYELDGPFCELARKVQIDQYHTMVTCLGREWFYDHPSPLIRATRGLVYLKEMTLDELVKQSAALKHSAENA